jgi:hypothetical protein
MTNPEMVISLVVIDVGTVARGGTVYDALVKPSAVIAFTFRISPGKRVTALLLNIMVCKVKAGVKSLAYAYELIDTAFLVNV